MGCRLRFLLFALLVLGAGPARAAGPRAIVLGTEPVRIPKLAPASLGALEQHLAAALRASGRYEVVPDERVKAALLDVARGRYLSCANKPCRSALATKLGASRLFATTLARRGRQCLVSLLSLDEKAEDPQEASARAACTEEALAGAIKAGVERLLGKTVGELPFRPAAAPWKNEKDGGEMIFVPAGPALLGAPADVGRANEHPARNVSVAAFYIDARPVSTGQFKRCVDAGACAAPAVWLGCRYDHSIKTRPVNCLGSTQAEAYCRWAGERLPTEAEWEKATRGPAGNLYPYAGRARSYSDQPIGYGVRLTVDGRGDLEWTSDCQPAPACRQPGAEKKLSPQEVRRVVRGLVTGEKQRLTYHLDLAAATRSPEIGFRCAKSP